MPRFKIGQRVVAIRDHSQGLFKKGDEFIVDGFMCCPKCGEPCVYLTEFNDIEDGFKHSACGFRIFEPTRVGYAESSFAPLHNHGEAIEYRLSVSLPELTEIKKEQLT